MRVLVAEDDPKMSSMVQKALENMAIAVDVAKDGEEALYMAVITEYDVILLDVVMPKKTGIEVCAELRQRGITTPVIIVSGRTAVNDRVEGLDSGADDYLIKPFSFSELTARVRAAVRRKDSAPKSTLQVDDLVLDPNKRTVMRGGNQILLSPKQYRVLEYLMRNHDKVVSRFDILENVWGSGESLFSNVVDVHMSHLRSKLNKGAKKKLIKTVRGGGYILEEKNPSEKA